MAPMSKACVVTAMMWFNSRVISPNSTAERGGQERGQGPRLTAGLRRAQDLHTKPGPGEAGRTSDPLCPRRRLDVQQFLHSQRVSLLIAHHGYVVQPVKVWKGLGRGRKQVPFQGQEPSRIPHPHSVLGRDPESCLPGPSVKTLTRNNFQLPCHITEQGLGSTDMRASIPKHGPAKPGEFRVLPALAFKITY